MINLVYRWHSTSNSHYSIIFFQFFLYIYPVNVFSRGSTYAEFFLYALLTRPTCFYEIAPVFIKTRDSKRENIDYSNKLRFLAFFLSHNKMSSKQNLNFLFILQSLLVGSEINTTLKQTLINITELSRNDAVNYEIRAICYTSLYCQK